MTYRQGVLNELLKHGVRPRPVTPPRLVRTFLNDVYRYELRQLRGRLLRGKIAKGDYAGTVVRLRARYPLLSLPIGLWAEE